MATHDLPIAIRATAVLKATVFGRRRRTFRYDARFADGRVERDVNIDKALDGRDLPADAWATRQAAEATCPEVGSGQWVDPTTN